MSRGAPHHRPVNTPGQILFACPIGTAIEFFDFYIYATAAVLVFPSQVFPSADPASATLASLATFGIAFLARPVGSALFGHFGDRVGRETTLVAALLSMGVSTVARGMALYQRFGLLAVVVPSLLPPPTPFKIFVLMAGAAAVAPLGPTAVVGATLGAVGADTGR